MKDVIKTTRFKFRDKEIFLLSCHVNLSVGERVLIDGIHYIISDKVAYFKDWRDEGEEFKSSLIQYYLRTKHPEE